METYVSSNDGECSILAVGQGRFTAEYRIDTVFLTAKSTPEGERQREIALAVKSREGTFHISPEVNEGRNAAIYCGNFTNSKFDQILYTVSSGCDEMYFCLYSAKYGNVSVLYDSFRFSAAYKFTAAYRDFFEIEVSGAPGQRYVLDIEKRMEEISDGFYSTDGRLLKDTPCNVGGVCGIFSVYSEEFKRMQLIASRRVTSPDSQATLGYILARLYWNGREFLPLDLRTALESCDAV